MSDFLFSTRRRGNGELRECLERYLGHVSSAIDEYEGDWGSLAVARGPHDLSPVVDEGGHISVLIGEPTVRIPPEPAGLSWRGSNRDSLHQLLKKRHPINWDDHLDGQFAVLVIDRATGQGMVVTDLFAFVPIFASKGSVAPDLVLGTHVDAVASAAGRRRDIDPVSAVDLLTNLTCTFPCTLYRGVTQEMPATATRFDARTGRQESHRFWRPVESNGFSSVREAALSLRAAVRDDAATACDGRSEVGLLLSGGEDSRAVLGAMAETTSVRAFVFADWHSREVRVASKVARAHGATLEVGIRAPSHYTESFQQVASMIGSHHVFTDVHGYGFHDRLGIQAMPVVFGGLSADSLLKGMYTRKSKVPPKAAPIDTVVRADLLREAQLRQIGFRDWLAELRPQSADEWTNLWPFAMRKHGGNVDGNRRLFRNHEVFHANAVVKIAAAVPAEWKLNRRLFLAAMRPFFRKTRLVPHAEYSFPAFGPWANRMLVPALGIARGIRALGTGEMRARQASWPKWGRVARSAAAAAADRGAVPLLDSPLGEIFVPGRGREVEAAVAEWYSLRRLLLLQLTYISSID